MNETQDPVFPEGFDPHFCLEVLFPLLHKAYQDGAESKFGLNREKWSVLGRMELALLGEFHWPEGVSEETELSIQQKLFPWDDAEKSVSSIGILARSKERRYLALRGTLGVFEWYHDLLFAQKVLDPEHNIRVHKGFWQLFEQLQAVLQPALGDASLPLTVVGHSLGGALAQLVAYALPEPPEEVVLIGSPRVGNAAFAEALEARCTRLYRLEYELDLIPALPPEKLTAIRIRYAHAGKSVRLQAWKKGENISGSERVRRLLLSHMPSIYREALQQYLKHIS